MKRLTPSLPDDVAAALHQESERRNMPESEIVQEAIRPHTGYWTSDDFAELIGMCDSGGIGPFSHELDDILADARTRDLEEARRSFRAEKVNTDEAPDKQRTS